LLGFCVPRLTRAVRPRAALRRCPGGSLQRLVLDETILAVRRQMGWKRLAFYWTTGSMRAAMAESNIGGDIDAIHVAATQSNSTISPTATGAGVESDFARPLDVHQQDIPAL
jgi:hypothetical protein